MSGRRAAYQVAMKNARRNRKRTLFLVLLVAVPVALGVVVAGLTRATNLTPEESAQTYFGRADVRVQQFWQTEGVDEWIDTNLRRLAPEATITQLRMMGIAVEEVGHSLVWDLDMSEPATDGILVRVSGDLPSTEGEVALSPALADEMSVDVGDPVEFDELPLGQMTVVGLVSQPFSTKSKDILVSPGSLAPLVVHPDYLPDVSRLVSGSGAEEAGDRLAQLWYSGGQEMFWPEAAVDPLPPEISFLEEDPIIHRMLSRANVDQLVDLAETWEPEPGLELESQVRQAAFQMIDGSGGHIGLAELHVESRSQWMSRRSLESDPAVVSTAVAAIVLIEVAFITGAAFAAGTRRRLREIGLMGSNGASMKHIRSTVVGEGLTIATAGAIAGVLLGITVMIVGRPIMQRYVSKVITGLGVNLTDVLGPVLVALLAVLLAVLIPARTASKIPTTTALQGRMPALAPRRWIVPFGIGLAGLGGLLVSVALVSTSHIAPLLVGVGATAVVGGIALLSSPILSGLSKLSDKVPATSRLVLRDSGRNRTRAAVAVSAIMVILLAPVIAIVTSTTQAEKDLVWGLPSPSHHLVLNGSWDPGRFSGASPVTDQDVAALAAVIPERDVAVYDTMNPLVTMEALLELRNTQVGDDFGFQQFTEGHSVALANNDLVRVLDEPGVTRSISNGEMVVLGIEDRTTRVEIAGVEYEAQEYAVPVVQWSMPRVLIPESMWSDFSDSETGRQALFTLERPMTEDEQQRMWALDLSIHGGYGHIPASTIYLLAGAATLAVVLIVVALVTAVSAAEVDQEVRTIVAVGAPGSIRRRFLGLLTGYQTLVAMALAVPLGLGLVWVFSSAQQYDYPGPFGLVDSSAMTVPWVWIGTFAVTLPLVVGLLTTISVRSAPVTPPRGIA